MVKKSSIIKNILIISLLIKEIVTRTNTNRRSPDLKVTNYWATFKHLKTGKIYKGRLRHRGSTEEIKDIEVKIVIYYEDKFLSEGESMKFTIFDRAIQKVTQNQRSKFSVDIEHTRFVREGLFTNNDTKLKGDVEFEITSGTTLQLSDLNNQLVIRSNDGSVDYQIIELERATGKQMLILIIMLIVLIISFIGTCTCVMILPEDKSGQFTGLWYGIIGDIFIAIACGRMVLEHYYLVSLWVIFTVYVFGSIINFILGKDNFKKIKMKCVNSVNTRPQLFIAWLILEFFFALLACIFVKLLPFLVILPLIGIIIDIKFLSSSPHITALKGVSAHIFMIIFIGFDYYSKVSINLHRVDMDHFYIWISCVIPMILLVFICGTSMKPNHYKEKDKPKKILSKKSEITTISKEKKVKEIKKKPPKVRLREKNIPDTTDKERDPDNSNSMYMPDFNPGFMPPRPFSPVNMDLTPPPLGPYPSMNPPPLIPINLQMRMNYNHPGSDNSFYGGNETGGNYGNGNFNSFYGNRGNQGGFNEVNRGNSFYAPGMMSGGYGRVGNADGDVEGDYEEEYEF